MARRSEREAIRDRQAAARTPVVLAEREKRDVRLEKGEGVLPLLVELDLELNGVGLEVDESAGLVVLRPRLRPAMQVDDQFCRGVEAPELLLAHSVQPAVGVQGVVGPAAVERERRERPVDEPGRELAAVVACITHQHPRRPRVGLDVVRLKAETTEADEVVDRLPNDSGDGNLGHHPEQDDLRTTAKVHA